MDFAGSCKDMPDNVFDELNKETAARRKHGFSERRSYETGFN
jgi:hypothetical protein